MNPTFEEVIHAQRRYFDLVYESWVDRLFTPQWWALLFVFIFPWIVWWRFVDKDRTGGILSFGLIVSIFASVLDESGHALHLWSYRYRLVPLCVELKPMNVSLLPVSYMFVYQYFSRWKSFVAAISLLAVFLAFVGEPFLVWFNIYEVYKWKHIYSLPIYIVLAVLARKIVELLIKTDETYTI